MTRAVFLRWAERLKRAHAAIALMAMNGVVAGIGLNGLLAAFPRSWGPVAPADRELGRMAALHGLDAVSKAYPGWSRTELSTLLGETQAGLDIEYEPFTSYRPRPLHGRFLNIAPGHYRNVREQGPWPPDPAACNIFVFGGSTTFGIGVPDADTIPSRLGDALNAESGRRVRVYNFGRPGYVAFQERLLFAQLLSAGRVPALAVFVDGLNEFYTWPRPVTADLMRRELAAAASDGWQRRSVEWLRDLPMGRAARVLASRLGVKRAPQVLTQPRASAADAVSEWLANKALGEALAADFGARALFVWQPVPWVGYDLRYHVFGTEAARARPAELPPGYALIDAWRKRAPEAGFLWLADAQAQRRDNLYVTETHYTPAFAAEIARAIARHVATNGLLACR